MAENFLHRVKAAKSPPRNDEQNYSGSNGPERRDLRIAHAPQHRGIDANELDQKSFQPEQHKKLARDHARTKRMLNGARASPPDVRIDQHAGDEFIDRRGMNSAVRRRSPLRTGLGCRHQAVGKCHAPRQSCWAAVVAVARNEAANAPHGIAHRGSRARNIEHGEHAHAVTPRKVEQRRDSCHESAEPGKPAAEPIHQRTEAVQSFSVKAVNRRINDVPDFCAHNAGYRNKGHNVVSIDTQFAALDLGFQRKECRGKSHQHQQAKGRQLKLANVNIRKQCLCLVEDRFKKQYKLPNRRNCQN